MKLPAWLDVALEGGALELQRALVRYRRLRHALAGDWRPKAAELAELCAATARREGAIDDALDRAVRRARNDPAAAAAAQLAFDLERERRRTAMALERRSGEQGSMAAMLGALEEVAREESHLELAWRRFRAERVAWTTGFGVLYVAFFAATWWSASDGGDVPTVVSLDGLRDGGAVGVALVAAGVLAALRLRLAWWSWLGVASPSLGVVPAIGGVVALVAMLCFATIANVMPLAAVAAGALAGLSLYLLSAAWWQVPKPVLSPVD